MQGITHTFAYKKFVAAGLVAMLMFSLVAVLSSGTASAHGRRDIANGKYQIVVGFLTEPAYTNNTNGIDLTICQGACENNADGTLKNPVKDADKTLKAEVIFGSQTLPVTLAPRFRADGKYNGYFTPSKAGDYTFHFTGTINGDQIDEKMASTKDGFGAVEDPKLFPAVQSSAADLQQQVKDAKDQASGASTFGIIGIVVGALGLIVAGIALALRSKPVTAVETREPVGSGAGRGPQGG